MITKLRVGIIGCGRISQIMHMPHMREMEDKFEIVALSDISQKLLDKLALDYQVKNTFLEYRDMLKMDELDAVLVATMDHAQVVLDAARSKKHIFVEKPAAFTLTEIEEMVKECEKNSVKLMVGYMKVYEPAFEYAKEYFEKIDVKLIRVHDFMEFVPIVSQELQTTYSFNDYEKGSPQEWYKSLIMNKIAPDLKTKDPEALSAFLFMVMGGIHDIAILTEAFGYPEAVLFTDIWKHTGSGPFGPTNGLGTFGSYVTSVLDYGENRRCILELGGTAKKWMDEDITVIGANDTVSLSFSGPFFKNAPAVLTRKYMDNGEIKQEVLIPSFKEKFKIELENFYDYIVNDKKITTDGIRAKKDMELIVKIVNKYLELKNG